MSVLQSLKKRNHAFKEESAQIELLSDHQGIGISSFQDKIDGLGLFPLTPTGIDVFQVNVGKMCNQVCKHCHVDAGPDRQEIMTRDTMQQCLDAIKGTDIKIVDLTGGAPEMNPDFRWFVEEITALGKSVIVRCNLTIILANPKYNDLPEFFKKHKVNVVSSLPYFTAKRTDAQRGDGVFEKSIKALKMLNDAGYALPDTGLQLDLVYNPTGAFLPGSQEDLEAEFRTRLRDKFQIEFNSLFAITNIPVSRFLEYLVNSKNYEDYMNELVNAFNPTAAKGVMCRNTISVGWDGFLFDCDFNQMLDLKVQNAPTHVSEFNFEALLKREIIVNQHCFGCTAGAGSSCGGVTS